MRPLCGNGSSLNVAEGLDHSDVGCFAFFCAHNQCCFSSAARCPLWQSDVLCADGGSRQRSPACDSPRKASGSPTGCILIDRLQENRKGWGWNSSVAGDNAERVTIGLIARLNTPGGDCCCCYLGSLGTRVGLTENTDRGN